jgi:hypothetical protein
MKKVGRIFLGLVVVLAIAFGALALWGINGYQPTDVALEALKSDAQVVVVQHDGFISFEPAGVRPAVGFVFYPGARVDYRAYAPVLHEIAASGYFVASVKVPVNFAIFDVNAADRVISQYPAISNWAVGGHSLGGAAAAIYAANNQTRLKGLILWASYPSGEALVNTSLKALSIYGTKDMAGMDAFDRSRSLLPADTQFVVIEGGNHAQFGSYGFQAGDNPANIPPEDQWMQISSATSKFLETLK